MNVLRSGWNGDLKIAKSRLSHAIVQLVPGFRLHWEEAEHAYVLLYPGGMITLDLCATEVLRRCDGMRTVQEIIAELNNRYPQIELEASIVDFIRSAESKGWISISY